MDKNNYKLCYIQGNFAFFTTQELDKQWGDDWNDAPYEHNAGEPYKPCWHREEGKCDCEICKRDWDGDKPKWEILKVAFETNLETPCYNETNSNYSVEDINKGIVAWLESSSYEKNPTRIFAGESLDEFILKIEKCGGEIFMPKGHKGINKGDKLASPAVPIELIKPEV